MAAKSAPPNSVDSRLLLDILVPKGGGYDLVNDGYASVSTTVNRAAPWDTKAWVSSGHSTEPEASKAAKERCQSDSQAQCIVDLLSMDGFIFAYRSAEGDIGIAVTRNIGGAKREMMENCKAQGTKCTVMKIIDAKQSAMEILDSKIGTDPS